MEVLLTFTGLLIAIYAIAPPSIRLALSLKLRLFDYVVVVVGLIFAVCFEFYDLLYSLVGPIFPWPWPVGLNPEKAINGIIIMVLLILAFRIKTAKISHDRIDGLQKLLAELLWEKNYTAVFDLVTESASKIFAIANKDHYWGRLKNKIKPNPWRDARFSPGSRRGITRRLTLKIRHALAAIIPDKAQAAGTANEIITSVIHSKQFIRAMADQKPYLGVALLTGWKPDSNREEFFSSYMKSLLENRASILYHELSNNLNLNAGHRYDIPASNRLLHYLFNDAKNAEKLAAYKPVGDYLHSELSRLALKSGLDDPYNQPPDHHNEVPASCPFNAGIHMFEIMVVEALHQGIEWHMWLYYLPSLVEEMIDNVCFDSPRVDQGSEYPTRYCQLISRSVNALRQFVIEVQNVPSEQSNVTLHEVNARHENGNIPKSSILAIGQCCAAIAKSNKLPRRFQHNVIDSIFRLYFHLRRVSLDDYASVLIAAIRSEGTERVRLDEEYLSHLRVVFTENDRDYIVHFNDYREDLIRGLAGEMGAPE